MSHQTDKIDDPLNRIAEGVVLFKDGRVERINTAAGKLLGTEPAWAAGRAPMAVLRDHRIEHAWLSRCSCELTVRGRVLQVTSFENGLTLRDITEVRRAEEDARELLAVLSHELRTPLTTVRSTLEALEYEGFAPEVRASLLKRALEEADRLVRLLNDLTVDVTPPRERSVLLTEAVERARAVLTPVLSSHRISLHSSASGVAWADPDKLLQVLINLIENAAIHGPDASQVEVRAEEAGGWVRVGVRDEGTPLSEERFVSAFALHVRGPSSESRGSGLGLYIVRSIAERWGGRAWGQRWMAGDDPGPPRRGNEFCFLVPASRDATRLPPPAALSGADTAGEPLV